MPNNVGLYPTSVRSGDSSNYTGSVSNVDEDPAAADNAVMGPSTTNQNWWVAFNLLDVNEPTGSTLKPGGTHSIEFSVEAEGSDINGNASCFVSLYEYRSGSLVLLWDSQVYTVTADTRIIASFTTEDLVSPVQNADALVVEFFGSASNAGSLTNEYVTLDAIRLYVDLNVEKTIQRGREFNDAPIFNASSLTSAKAKDIGTATELSSSGALTFTRNYNYDIARANETNTGAGALGYHKNMQVDVTSTLENDKANPLTYSFTGRTVGTAYETNTGAGALTGGVAEPTPPFGLVVDAASIQSSANTTSGIANYQADDNVFALATNYQQSWRARLKFTDLAGYIPKDHDAPASDAEKQRVRVDWTAYSEGSVPGGTNQSIKIIVQELRGSTYADIAQVTHSGGDGFEPVSYVYFLVSDLQDPTGNSLYVNLICSPSTDHGALENPRNIKVDYVIWDAEVVRGAYLDGATETSDSIAVAHGRSFGVGTASESALATTTGRGKAKGVSSVSETDTAPTGSAEKSVTAGTPSETNSAALEPPLRIREAGRALETDKAWLTAPSEIHSTTQASETSTAPAVRAGRILTAGTAYSTDRNYALSHSKAMELARAEELDGSNTTVPSRTSNFYTAFEQNGGAGSLSSSKVRTVGTAYETSSSPVATPHRTTSISRAEEITSSTVISHSKALSLSTASENGFVYEVVADRIRDVGSAFETDIHPLSDHYKHSTLDTATEHVFSLRVQWAKAVEAGTGYHFESALRVFHGYETERPPFAGSLAPSSVYTAAFVSTSNAATLVAGRGSVIVEDSRHEGTME